MPLNFPIKCGIVKRLFNILSELNQLTQQFTGISRICHVLVTYSAAFKVKNNVMDIFIKYASAYIYMCVCLLEINAANSDKIKLCNTFLLPK